MFMTVEMFWLKVQSDGVDHQYEWRGGSGKFYPTGSVFGNHLRIPSLFT